MSVLRLILGKKGPVDRPARARQQDNLSDSAPCSEIGAELLAFLDDIKNERLKMSSTDDVVFLSEHRALQQKVEQSLSLNSSESNLVDHWREVRAFASQQRRNEEIYVEGRFFEYQQILFDFSRLFRQMESVRSSTLKHIGSVLVRQDEVSDDDLKKFKNLLEREARELRTTSNTVSDRIQAIRNMLLEERVVPELDALTGLLSAKSFQAAISRYISVSACTGESLTLLQFTVPGSSKLDIISNAIEQTFRRQTDCKGMISDRSIGVLILNVTKSNVKLLVEHVVDFVASADVAKPEVHLAVARHDDTPEMLLARCSSE